MTQEKLASEIARIRKKLTNQGKNIEVLFSYFDEFIHKPRPRRKIGFNVRSAKK
jgi:hypothetical protein